MSALEYGSISLNKRGEQLCGDRVAAVKEDGVSTLVLADGLGSGVKANILSTLTSKILSTMIANGISLDECIDTIIGSLPVCKVRGVAYSTFSILSLDEDGRGTLVEFDNPPAVYLKNGRYTPTERREREYRGKKIYVSPIEMNDDDVILLMSDGVIHAGVGQALNFGWDIKEIREFTEIQYDPSLSAPTMASILTNACWSLYGQQPGDDTTVLAVKKRRRFPVSVMIGPPVDRERDAAVVREFMAQPGEKIVCGGTSSQVVARVLGRELTTSFDYPDKDVPPIGYIDGIDLVCEGVLTLKKALSYAETYADPTYPGIKQFKGRDGASLLCNELLIKATDVAVYLGRNVNLAHEGLSIDNKTKLDTVTRLTAVLRELGKNVTLKYN